MVKSILRVIRALFFFWLVLQTAGFTQALWMSTHHDDGFGFFVTAGFATNPVRFMLTNKEKRKIVSEYN